MTPWTQKREDEIREQLGVCRHEFSVCDCVVADLLSCLDAVRAECAKLKAQNDSLLSQFQSKESEYTRLAASNKAMRWALGNYATIIGISKMAIETLAEADKLEKGDRG